MVWTIQRIESAVPGTATLECLEGQEALTVTLKELDTGEVAVTQICKRIDDPDPCTMLGALGVTYTPNDWSDECA